MPHQILGQAQKRRFNIDAKDDTLSKDNNLMKFDSPRSWDMPGVTVGLRKFKMIKCEQY